MRITARGRAILSNAMINRGTAFTETERERLGLTGLLPTGVTTIEGQMHRTYEQYERRPDDLSKFAYLSALRARNAVLFYRLFAEHLREMLPVVYTPTIGEAIQQYSHWYSRPQGVHLSIDHPETLEQSLRNYGLEADEVDLVVVTDSEGILGIGDQGVGGIQIVNGKLSVYTAAAGIDPRRALPVVLDVGTDNLELLNDELYLGARHSRVRGERYDAFVHQFVETVTRLFPRALLHWEDFGAANAHRILQRYRDECCTFNDDVQGTAAVVTAAALAAVKATGQSMSDQRIVVHGAGTAGIGIAELMRDVMVREGLSVAEANRRFWGLGSQGLLRSGMADRLRPFQLEYARPDTELAGWVLDRPGRYDLADVVRNVHPTILIGTSAQGGCFTERIVRDMAQHVERPIIMPLSNPTIQAEAVPTDLLAWTQGAALIATGSPFPDVLVAGARHEIAQANNALVFPGIGLGVVVSKATRITDGMIAAAAEAVASLVTIRRVGQPLLPSVDKLRMVSATVAKAVVAAAHRDGVATVDVDDPVQQVYDAMWQPTYPELVFDGD